MLSGLRLATGTLTLMPVGQLPMPITRPVARWAMTLAVPAVVPLGLVAAAVGWAGMTMRLPLIATAVLVIGVAVYLTRGMHVDGLADTVDGFGAGWDRERALSVMKVGDVGPMGAVALILTLGAQIACVTVLLLLPWGAAIVGTVICLARSAAAVCCVRGVPSARPGGMGSAMAQSVPRSWCAAVVTLTACSLVGLATVGGLPWWQGLVSGVAGFVAVGVVLIRARKVFGGITGDVIGAGIEIWLTAVVLLLSAGGW